MVVPPILSCLYHGFLVDASRPASANRVCIIALRKGGMPAAACSMYSESRMEYEISPQDLHAKLKELAPDTNAESLCLLDVRESWESATATIPSSRSIPMGDIPSRANQELDPDAHIVVYCHHGGRSLSVALWLREQGFSRAQSLSGGIDAWAEKIDPSMTRY